MLGIRTVFVGRITKKPELKTVGDGKEVCRFSVAVSRYAGKEKETVTDFVNCSAWGSQGAAIEKYFNQGDQIIIDGDWRSSKKDKTTYWEVNVNSFEFGAKKKGDAAPASAPVEGFNEADIPF